MAIKKVVALPNLGKGFQIDIPSSKINVAPSADAGNAVVYGSDNLLKVTPVDFWRSGAGGTTLPDGVADLFETIRHDGKVGIGGVDALHTLDVGGSFGASTLTTGGALYSALDVDHTVHLTSLGPQAVVLLSAVNRIRRQIILVNPTIRTKTVSAYISLAGVVSTIIPAYSSIFLISDNVDWRQVAGGSAPGAGTVIGDIKQSFINTDANGWYLLDGRLKSSLSATAQSNATTIGIGANLPNATGRVLAQGIAGAVVGANTATILQANLPNISLTSAAGGAHTHTFTTMDNGGGVDGTVSQANNSTPNSNATTSAAPTHTHTVPLGGSGTALNVQNAQIGFPVLIYLGL